MRRALVTGSTGFIGSHLVTRLKREGYWVRGVDRNELPVGGYSPYTLPPDNFIHADLRDCHVAHVACQGVDDVYALAADMGGMGFIKNNNATILHNNSLITTYTIEGACAAGVDRYLYTSSACVYPLGRQTTVDTPALKESEAYPAEPEDGYGWEKLIGERLCQYYAEDRGMNVRVVRFHNIYGPYGTWRGGREKAPAALCRKIAVAELTGDPVVEIWGDGQQTRSFCYVEDCVTGVRLLMESQFTLPINLGTERMISIADLADLIAVRAGVKIEKRFVEGPQGVRGRNSDNSLLRQVLGWEPDTSLEVGIDHTYRWVRSQVKACLDRGEDVTAL